MLDRKIISVREAAARSQAFPFRKFHSASGSVIDRPCVALRATASVNSM